MWTNSWLLRSGSARTHWRAGEGIKSKTVKRAEAKLPPAIQFSNRYSTQRETFQLCRRTHKVWRFRKWRGGQGDASASWSAPVLWRYREPNADESARGLA